jgi:hypothetical protein
MTEFGPQVSPTAETDTVGTLAMYDIMANDALPQDLKTAILLHLNVRENMLAAHREAPGSERFKQYEDMDIKLGDDQPAIRELANQARKDIAASLAGSSALAN